MQGAPLNTFFDTVVASAIFYGEVCWGSSRKRLDKLIEKASSVLGCSFHLVEMMGERRMMATLLSLMNNDSHPRGSFSDRLLHPKCVKE